MVIEEHAKLEITLPDGRFFAVSEADIIQNSLSVTSQCVSGNTFGFGCVSPAQLSVKIRIKSQEIGRYDVYGAEIVLYSWFGKNPPDDNGKRGVFNVTSVTKNGDIFTISASDNVCLLDSSAFEGNGDGLGNAVYRRLGEGGALWHAIDALGIVTSEFAQDFSGQLLRFHTGSLQPINIPNGIADFKGYGIPEEEQKIYDIQLVLLLSDEQSDNIRDYVSWLAEYMGGFVTADKNGAIQFNLFENSYYQEPEILDFSDFQQNTLEIAGFRIYLYSAKVITENKTWCACNYGKYEAQGVINVENVIQNNPFIEFIYNYHSQFNDCDFSPIVNSLYFYQRNIQIRPFSGIYHGNHYLHLGQYIKIRDRNGAEHETTITNITWKFRGGQQIKCVGEDSRTLSQARKRTQAVRMGERMKTQINRLENKITDRIGTIENNDFQSQIDSVGVRIQDLENKDFQWQIDDLRARIEALESGGEEHEKN